MADTNWDVDTRISFGQKSPILEFLLYIYRYDQNSTFHFFYERQNLTCDKIFWRNAEFQFKFEIPVFKLVVDLISLKLNGRKLVLAESIGIGSAVEVIEPRSQRANEPMRWILPDEHELLIIIFVVECFAWTDFPDFI